MVKYLGLMNINRKVNIIHIVNENTTYPTVEDTFFKNYDEYFKNNKNINYISYTEDSIIDLLKKEDFSYIYEKYCNTQEKLILKLYLLYFHNGGILISNDFLYYDSSEIFTKNNIISDDFSLLKLYNISFIEDCLKNFENYEKFKKICIDNNYILSLNKDSKFNNNICFNKKIYLENYHHLNNILIKKSGEYDNILYNKNKFYIKSERNSGSTFLEKILNYYFNSNYTESIFFEQNNYGPRHHMFSDNLKNKINKNKVITIILKKNIFSWLLSMFSNLGDFHPKKNEFIDFIQTKCCDKDNFHCDDIEQFDDVFDMYYKKYDNFIDTELDKKICINYEDLVYSHYDLIKLLSKQFNLKILKDYNKEFDIYHKRDYYVNEEYLKRYNKNIMKYIYGKKNIKVEEKWNKILHPLKYTLTNSNTYLPKISHEFACITYFDGEKDDIYKLRLSQYLFNQNFSKCDIYIYYTSDNLDVEDFDIPHKHIHFLKYSNKLINLLDPDFIQEKFKYYDNILFLKYDFYLNSSVSLQEIDCEFVYFNTDTKKIDTTKYKDINEKINTKLFDFTEFEKYKMNISDFFIAKKNIFNNQNIKTFFNTLKNKDMIITVDDLFFYINYTLQDELKKINFNIKYLDKSLKF